MLKALTFSASVSVTLSSYAVVISWGGNKLSGSTDFHFRHTEFELYKNHNLIFLIRSRVVNLMRTTHAQKTDVKAHERSCELVKLLKPTGHVMHHQFNIQQLYVMPTLYLCVLYLYLYLYLYLRTNNDLCHLQRKLIGSCNRDEKCLQRGTDWVFKYSGLRFVCKGLNCPIWRTFKWL